MAGRVGARRRRTGEDELALGSSFIDCVSCKIPQTRFELPFIDKARSIACKQQPWIRFHGKGNGWIRLYIEEAFSLPLGSLSLPTALGTLDQDATLSPECALQLSIR